MMQRLANLAVECNIKDKIFLQDNNDDDLIDEDHHHDGVLYDKNDRNHLTLEFDV